MNSKILMIIVIIVVAGAAFFGGIQYQKSQRSSSRLGQFGPQGQLANRTGQQGGIPVSGSIISSDNTSINVKLADGSSKIVFLSGATVVNKQTIGSRADLKTGEKVLVIGKNNSDGSITADNISLNTIPKEIVITPTITK